MGFAPFNLIIQTTVVAVTNLYPLPNYTRGPITRAVEPFNLMKTTGGCEIRVQDDTYRFEYLRGLFSTLQA